MTIYCLPFTICHSHLATEMLLYITEYFQMKRSLIQFTNDDWNELTFTSHLKYGLSNDIPKTKYIFNKTNGNDYKLLMIYLTQIYYKYIDTSANLEINLSYKNRLNCKQIIVNNNDNDGNNNMIPNLNSIRTISSEMNGIKIDINHDIDVNSDGDNDNDSKLTENNKKLRMKSVMKIYLPCFEDCAKEILRLLHSSLIKFKLSKSFENVEMILNPN